MECTSGGLLCIYLLPLVCRLIYTPSQMTGIDIMVTFAFNWLLNALISNFFGNFEIFTEKATLIECLNSFTEVDFFKMF